MTREVQDFVWWENSFIYYLLSLTSHVPKEVQFGLPFKMRNSKGTWDAAELGVSTRSWGPGDISSGPVGKRGVKCSPAVAGTLLPQQCLHGTAEEGEALSHSSLSS